MKHFVKTIIRSVTFCFFFINNCFVCLLQPHLFQITPPVDHAEGPTWDGRKNVLYFVDIHAGSVYSYEYFTGRLSRIKLNGEVTPVIPSTVDPETFIIGLNRSVFAIKWNRKSRFIENYKHLTTVSNQFPTSRFNDGKADKQGRLWFGTMGSEDSKGVTPNQGVLYKITKMNLHNPSVMIAPVNISNGLAWNKENNKFYYIDTPTKKIMEFQYDDDNGEIKNGRVAFDLQDYKEIGGFPDGMTIDTEGYLWVALYNGGSVIKVDPRTGKLLQVIAIPAEAVTSAIWGGPNLDILFITTSRFRLSEKRRKRQPAAGSVFALTGLATRGEEAFKADVVDPL